MNNLDEFRSESEQGNKILDLPEENNINALKIKNKK